MIVRACIRETAECESDSGTGDYEIKKVIRDYSVSIYLQLCRYT